MFFLLPGQILLRGRVTSLYLKVLSKRETDTILMAKQTIRLATPIKQMRQPGRYHEDCLSCSWVYCQHSQRLFRPLLRRNDISLTEKKKKLLEAHIYWSHHLHRFPTWCLKVRNSYPSFFFPSLALYWKDGDGVSIEASLSKEQFFFSFAQSSVSWAALAFKLRTDAPSKGRVGRGTGKPQQRECY